MPKFAQSGSTDRLKPLPDAVISTCKRYRYFLQRRLSDNSKIMTFAMINPSTADAKNDDRTIKRCKEFAIREECGVLQVVNLFAWRDPDRDVLLKVSDPVGSENRKWIQEALNRHTPGSVMVCAWGDHKAIGDQDRVFLTWLAELGVNPFALKITKNGYPGHPLYVSGDAALVPYSGRETS